MSHKTKAVADDMFQKHKQSIAIGILSLLLGMASSPITAHALGSSPVITTVEGLTTALLNAESGDTIYVGDITFKPMPMGMITVPKNVTIKSGIDGNATFQNATFALTGTLSAASPLTVTFENINFEGDRAGKDTLPDASLVSTSLPSIMKTMCAAIFKQNVNATFNGCNFEGYHYGYGGVFNAIYSSADNLSSLQLTLNDCDFSNNLGSYGGCIYLSGYDQNISLEASHCTFQKNAATTGGAIYADHALVSLEDCTLSDNYYLPTTAKQTDGGAITLSSSETTLDGCSFIGNATGGDGGAIYAEISPFRTLIMQNCTLWDNESDGVSIVPLETNYTTKPLAHVYFSTLFDSPTVSQNAELFGCLIEGETDKAPSAETNYCRTFKDEKTIPTTASHIKLENEITVPNEALLQVGGGKFLNSLGSLQVGDNYSESVTLQLEYERGKSEPLFLSYGDELVLPSPERKGYAFEGWLFDDGTSPNGSRFFGGKVPSYTLTASWKFLIGENLHVIYLPIASILLVGGVSTFLLLRKKKPAAQTPTALPVDWIDRVCEKAEITELLSKRELEVLHKLLEGTSRKQIAEELFISEATVRKHSTSIYQKLKVHNRTELIFKLTQ